MSACTIYVRHSEPRACVAELQRRAEQLHLEIHPLLREAAGDKFSKLILGTHNYARARTSATQEHPVLRHILETGVIVGVPDGFSEPATIHSGVASVAADMDAIVFDGHTFRDCSGHNLFT